MEPERYLTLTGYTIAGHSTTARPDLAQELGFVGAKYPLAYGPADGDAGLKKNVEIHKKWRAAVGPDFPLMVDCYMSLTVPYAIRTYCTHTALDCAACLLSAEATPIVRACGQLKRNCNALSPAELAQALAPHGIKWMEEFLQPDDYAGHAAGKNAVLCPHVLLKIISSPRQARDNHRESLKGRPFSCSRGRPQVDELHARDSGARIQPLGLQAAHRRSYG